MITPENLKRANKETVDDFLVRLFSNKEEYEIDNYTIANLMNEETGQSYSESKYRKDFASFKRWEDYLNKQKGSLNPDDPDYKETVEILPDGSHKSDKLLKMSAKDTKDPKFLLESHGYDPNKWELSNAKNNIWNSYSKQDGIMTLYSSRITAKPLKQGFDFDRLTEIVTQKPKYTIKSNTTNNIYGDYLLLPLYDMHFGINTFEDYREVQEKILKMLENNYKEVLLIFGQDSYHNDSMFNGRTAKGTEIEKVDMVQAWKDSSDFFLPVIHKAIDTGSKVTIVYSKGNHSETIEWAFVQYLKAVFPDCGFDDSLKERKVHMFGSNLLGFSHGDKKNEKRLPENFATEFPKEWSRATTRTVFTGHFHSEQVNDIGGILVRRMPTQNKTDQWHDDKGYTTAHKRFQVHEFNEHSQTGLFYL